MFMLCSYTAWIVSIAGRLNLNRAVHDDVVAIEMLPQSEWSCPSSLILEDEAVADDDTDETDEKVSLLPSNRVHSCRTGWSFLSLS